MRILILGYNGLLASTFINFIKTKNVDYYSISRIQNKNKRNFFLGNFSNFKKLRDLIVKINPSHIVNCVGITKYHDSYKSFKKIKIINTDLPKMIAKFCNKNKIYFIHISTDCVFSGKKGNYNETSKKDSKDLYGLSKSKGEVKNIYSTTIRTSFIGPEIKTRKSLLNWFLNQRKIVNGYNNAFFSGLTSLELSQIIFKHFIFKKNFYNKIINVGGDRISKYNLLRFISKVFKKKIILVKFPNFKIDRSLDSRKFKKNSKYKKKPWLKMIKELRFFMIEHSYKF